MAQSHNILALGSWSEDAQVMVPSRPLCFLFSPRKPRPSVRSIAATQQDTECCRRRTAAAPACPRPTLLTLCLFMPWPVQEHRLTIIDLVVGHSGDEIVRQPAVARLASFQHSGRVSAVEVR